MVEKYTVRLEKAEFVFSAAHFITFNGNICEPIHGHNYGVFAEIEGPLDENQYVVDFIAAQKSLRSLIDQLDHHVMLPLHHPQITLTVEESEVTARFAERRWVFPRQECALLPVENTTAEAVAAWLGSQFQDAITSVMPNPPTRIRLGIDECNGQWGIWNWQAPVRAPLAE